MQVMRLIKRLVGRVNQSVDSIAPFSVSDHKGKLPLVAVRTATVDMRQTQKHLVPTLVQVNRSHRPRRQVLVRQPLRGMVLPDVRLRLFPRRSRNFAVVYPNLRATAVPATHRRPLFVARTAVSVQLNLRTHLLRLGRVNVSPGVCRLFGCGWAKNEGSVGCQM